MNQCFIFNYQNRPNVKIFFIFDPVWLRWCHSANVIRLDTCLLKDQSFPITDPAVESVISTFDPVLWVSAFQKLTPNTEEPQMLLRIRLPSGVQFLLYFNGEIPLPQVSKLLNALP